jgi:drug/metabolite transporter (DMT)-like permease
LPRNRLIAALTSPYVLLSFAILCWGGNFVAARLANADIPPVALSFWRHTFAALLVLPFILPVLRTDWPNIRANLGNFALMGLVLAIGNTLVYFAVLHTTVINAALINSGVPVAAVAFSWLILRDVINRWQAIGILVAIAGIVMVVTKAQLSILLDLQFGWGDLYMLLAIISWALYMVLLKRASIKISGWSLLTVLSAAGALWLVPAYALEISYGHTMEWTGLSLLSLGYVTLFSTIIAWVCWNSGTLRIGPNRASAFMCLHPIFGPVFGMIFFGEILRPYHGVGTILVLAGVIMVSRVYAAPPPVKTT